MVVFNTTINSVSYDTPPAFEQASSSLTSSGKPMISDSPIKANTYELLLALELIQEFSRLPENWDGYGALPISPEAVGAASIAARSLYSIAPAAEIFPNSNGTITFEWESPRGLANLEIGKSRFSFYLQLPPLFIPAEGLIDEIDGISASIGSLVANDLFGQQGRYNTVSLTSNYDDYRRAA